ncbi:MAG TPA: Uma2 family endonuclease [Ardenticatenaceae bacterium]|nr:Uma2 family endonuclease [Ardenticatenaceae bacterium]
MATTLEFALQATRDWPAQGAWTYDDWGALPADGNRYEVIDGVLYMTPSPAIAHQASSLNLVVAMTTHVRHHQLGRVLPAPVDVLLPTQPVSLQPDIVFISKERYGTIGQKRIEGVPDLVVEILSPGNRQVDRDEKQAAYQKSGVPEYWIIDYRARTVEVFVLNSGGYVLLGKWAMGETASSRVMQGFRVAVADIVQDVEPGGSQGWTVKVTSAGALGAAARRAVSRCSPGASGQ